MTIEKEPQPEPNNEKGFNKAIKLIESVKNLCYLCRDNGRCLDLGNVNCPK